MPPFGAPFTTTIRISVGPGGGGGVVSVVVVSVVVVVGRGRRLRRRRVGRLPSSPPHDASSEAGAEEREHGEETGESATVAHARQRSHALPTLTWLPVAQGGTRDRRPAHRELRVERERTAVALAHCRSVARAALRVAEVEPEEPVLGPESQRPPRERDRPRRSDRLAPAPTRGRRHRRSTAAPHVRVSRAPRSRSGASGCRPVRRPTRDRPGRRSPREAGR